MENATIIAGVWLLALWLAETLVPFYTGLRGRERYRHAGKNVGMSIFNALLTIVVRTAALVAADTWAASRDVGLLRLAEWSPWIELLCAFVALDLWMYVWHRANHTIAFLWRFHRVHHSDPDMDVTTGLRFHPGEITLSALALSAVIPLLGASLWHFAVYETVLNLVVLFHHSNVRLPRPVDHGLLVLTVTPAMHRVHHSRRRAETDSNYGSVLPWWDVLFRSFRLRDDARTIRLGLDELDGPDWQGFGGMLRTPFRSVNRPDAGPRDGKV